jgi:hypothetical protein
MSGKPQQRAPKSPLLKSFNSNITGPCNFGSSIENLLFWVLIWVRNADYEKISWPTIFGLSCYGSPSYLQGVFRSDTIHRLRMAADISWEQGGTTLTTIDPTSTATASSGNVSTAATQITSTAAVKASTPSVQPGSTVKADTVKLSLAANIRSMYQQGISPSVIAAQLGISVKQVGGYIPGYNSAAPTASAPESSSSDNSTQAATAASTQPSAKQDAASQAQPTAPPETPGAPTAQAIPTASGKA